MVRESGLYIGTTCSYVVICRISAEPQAKSRPGEQLRLVLWLEVPILFLAVFPRCDLSQFLL